MLLIEVAVAAVLATWLVGSIVNQFRFAWFQRIAERDSFALLPLWTFFAPNPGQSDYHVVYRDRHADGSMTDWREIDITEPRRWYSFLWNPEKRSKKVLSDIVASLVDTIGTQPDLGNAIMLTLPYLLLLNVISQLDTTPDVTHRQFVIVETFGFNPTDKPRVILRSDFHALTSGRAA